jgi:hypothetical protein
MSRPALSISSELNLILEALEGIQLLTKLQAEHHLIGKQRHRATLATAAGLVVIRERLRQLDRVVRGVADPRKILISENRGLVGDDELQVATWGTKRTLAHHRREAERAHRAHALRANRKVTGAG